MAYRRWPAVWRWLPPLAWMGLIFALSAQPTLPQMQDSLADLLLKKGAHMTEYAILFFLLWLALRRPSPWWAWALALLYAVSDEVHQTFVPGRHGWYGDVIVDGVGASIAALAVWRARNLSAR